MYYLRYFQWWVFLVSILYPLIPHFKCLPFLLCYARIATLGGVDGCGFYKCLMTEQHCLMDKKTEIKSAFISIKTAI